MTFVAELEPTTVWQHFDAVWSIENCGGQENRRITPTSDPLGCTVPIHLDQRGKAAQRDEIGVLVVLLALRVTIDEKDTTARPPSTALLAKQHRRCGHPQADACPRDEAARGEAHRTTP